MSNKREREKRREQRLREESRSQSGERRQRLLQMAAGAVFIAIVVVVALIVINGSSSDDGGDTQIEHAAEADSLLGGIPQQGLTLGDPDAPVELVEWGDLQCPVCKSYAEDVLPPLIEGQVAQGQAKITFRNLAFIGEQSPIAGAAAIAAGEQGRGWQFLDLFYRNQGAENSGYADDEFLTAVAKGAGVKDIARWNKDRNSAAVKGEVEETSTEAGQLGVTGTPTYAIDGPATKGLEIIGTPGSSEDLEAAIDAAS